MIAVYSKETLNRQNMSLTNLRNIGSSTSLSGVNDQFYRYKRSSVEVTYRATGKGHTKIENIKQISHELQTEPGNLIKYLKKQLNATFDKEGMIHAKVDKEKIETEIDKYIDLYVLCPRCKLPEYHAGYCNACGYTMASASSTSLNERKDKIKSLKLVQKDKMIKDIHDCLQGVKKERVEVETPEMQAEKRLACAIYNLYEIRDSTTTSSNEKMEIDFLLDCIWTFPELDDLVTEGGKVTSSRFMAGHDKVIKFVQDWINGDERARKIVTVLKKISTLTNDEDFNSPELEEVKDDSMTKTLKNCYTRHLKINREIGQWRKRIGKMKLETVVTEAETEMQKREKMKSV